MVITTLPAEQVQCQVKSDDDDLDLDHEDNAPAKTGYYFCKNVLVSDLPSDGGRLGGDIKHLNPSSVDEPGVRQGHGPQPCPR
jgi:hypothetical protein